MLTLVVVPPALGLPSLDAECLAAISYLTYTLPEDTWEVVADSNGVLAGRSGTWHGLPGLWDGDKLISGYEQIVDHLKETSDGNWDLDRHLSEKEKAKQYGAKCALSTKLRALVSLLLYTSSENWVKVTRPALGSILSFPTSWVLPIHYREEQISISSSLGISSAQLTAAAASLTAKRKLKKETRTSAAQVDPLDDEEIVRPSRATDYIPFFGSASATLSVHRQLRQTTKDILSLFASYVESEPQLLQNGEAPTSLGCALFAHLALAIAAAERPTPHPFVTSVLHAEYPRLEKLVEDWMDEEWGFELGGSKAQHARKRRAAANKNRIQGLPWTDRAPTLGLQTKGFLADWVYVSGWVRPWSSLGPLNVREPSNYDSSGAVVYEPTLAEGRGLGHRTDALVGVTVALSAIVLGYQAVQEGF